MSKVFSHIQSGISNAGLASDPSDPQDGDLYYNTTSNVFRQYINGAWQNVGTSSTTGTVTSVSVVSANGLAGTVANATTTPALTLSTTITGILQGNGTAISAASTTGSGNVVLATSPTLITPTLGAATATSLSLTNALTVPNGGTGSNLLTQYAVLLGNGASNITSVGPGVSGSLLTGQGSTFPTFSITPTLGVSQSTQGSLSFASSNTAGLAVVQNLSASSNYNFNLPATAGSSGQVLTSQGGSSQAMIWTTVAQVGPGDISNSSATLANNQSSPANVTGLSFSTSTVTGFQVFGSVTINATADLYATFVLNGIYKTASTTWEMSSDYVGDVTGVVFSITSAGQIQYTSSNYTGFASGIMKYRAITV
jgi:hypothetical protein